MPRFFVLSACLASLAAAAACGDDDGGDGDTSVSTGLPRNDELSSLDDEDAVQACVNTAMSFNDVLSDSELERISCVLLAVESALQDGSAGEAGAIEDCEEFTKDCQAGEIDGLEDIDITIVSETDCSDAAVNATFSSCEATVGDYEDCAGEVKRALRRKLSSVRCDVLDDPDEIDALRADIDISDAPKCQALRDECPNIDFSG